MNGIVVYDTEIPPGWCAVATSRAEPSQANLKVGPRNVGLLRFNALGVEHALCNSVKGRHLGSDALLGGVLGLYRRAQVEAPEGNLTAEDKELSAYGLADTLTCDWCVAEE